MARVALKPPFRRDLAALPQLRLGLAVAALGAVAVAVTLFLTVRWTLHASAAAAVVGFAFLWWRARPGYGQGRGWPAGSLGIGASLDAIDNPRFYLEQAARYGPIFKMSQFGRPVLCVVGLSRGRALLQEHASALAGAALPYNRFAEKGLLRYMPRDQHREEGPLFRRAFSEAALAEGEADARRSLRTHLERAAEASARTPGGVDVRPFLGRWVIDVLADIMFGLRAGDARLDDLDRIQGSLQLERSGGAAWRASMERGLSDATRILRALATAPRAPGAPPSVLDALVQAAPETLEDEGRLRNLFLMFRLGAGDLMGTLAWVSYQLSANVPWQDKVCHAGRVTGAPNGMQPGDLGTRVVLETLRLQQSEYLYRRVVKPMAYEGYQIPAGWILRICVHESHRDPAIFPDPATFDPDRFLGRTLSKSEYATFGLDGHGCMGAAMVYFFGRILVEELCAGYTIRTTQDGPLEHGTRHRHHWRPSHRWAIAVDRRS